MSSSPVQSPDASTTNSETPFTSHTTTDTLRMATQTNSSISTPTQAQYANVTKLTSTTFHNWKLSLETVLGAYKLRRFILEPVTPLLDPTLLEAHQTSDFQALSAIHSTIDDESYQIISSCTTAHKAHQAICRHHGDTGGKSTATLFFELVNLRVTSDINIKDHVHQFLTLHNKLKSTIRNNDELKISDHFIAILLLFSLPSNFAPLVQTTLTTTAFDKIEINHLYMLILVSDTVETSDSITTNANSAMVASGSKDKKSFSRYDKSEKYKSKNNSDNPPRCSRGHVGHTDERCRIQIAEAKYKQIAELVSRLDEIETNKSESAKLATTVLEYDEAFITSQTSLMVITLGAGATSHMFSNSSLLSRCYSINPLKVEVAAKDKPILATTKGSEIMNKLPLHDVLVSHELGANLVSSGKLYDLGYYIEWGRTYAHVKDQEGTTLFTFYRDPFDSRLWQRKVCLPSELAMLVRTKRNLADLWHCQLGHLHPTAVI